MKLDRRHLLGNAGMGAMGIMLQGCGSGSASSAPDITILPPAPMTGIAVAPTPTPTPTNGGGTPAQTSTALLAQAGDSIATADTSGRSSIELLGLDANIILRNAALPGRTMAAGFAYRNEDLFAGSSGMASKVLIIQQGTNDLSTFPATAAWLYDLATRFVRAGQSAGFRVILNSVLPRRDAGWTPAMERQRILYNNLVRRNGARAQLVNDLASSALIGDSTDPSRSSYYVDGLHLSLDGATAVADFERAAVRSLLGLG